MDVKWFRKGVVFAAALFAGAATAGVDIDATHSGMQVRGADTIRLRNVNVPSVGYFWVDLQWDAEAMVFRPVNANRDVFPQFLVTQTIHDVDRSFVPDFDAYCSNEFGNLYVQAEWSDVLSVVGNDETEFQTFSNTIQLASGRNYLVKYQGLSANGGGQHHYFSTSNNYDSRYPSVNPVYGSFHDLYVQARSSLGGQVLCIKTTSENPFSGQ